MMDDRVGRLLKFLGAEEKRGFLWNMMSPNFRQYCSSSTLLLHPGPVAGDLALIKHDPIQPAVVQQKPPTATQHPIVPTVESAS